MVGVTTRRMARIRPTLPRTAGRTSFLGRRSLLRASGTTGSALRRMASAINRTDPGQPAVRFRDRLGSAEPMRQRLFVQEPSATGRRFLRYASGETSEELE